MAVIKHDAATWHERFLALAFVFAGWSKDPHCKVGAVVVSPDRRSFSGGYNGFPRGTPDDEGILSDRDAKRAFMVHAEVNAVLNAGFDVHGCTMYATRFPCHECAKAIVQSGISELVCGAAPDFDHPTWGKSYEVSVAFFAAAGVTVRVPA